MTGYAPVAAPGPGTYSFTGGHQDGAHVIAAEFLAYVPTLYWDINGVTAGAGGATPAGTWDATTNLNWNTDSTGGGGGSVSAWSAGQTARFGAGADATGAYTVVVDGTQAITGLAFDEGTVTLATGTAGALRMDANSVMYVASGLTATVETAISEDGGGSTPRQMYKTGTGTLNLFGNLAHTGSTTVIDGKLVLSGDNSAATGGMTLSGGVTEFESLASINGTARDVAINSGGVVMFGPIFGAGDIPAGLNRIVAGSAGVIAANGQEASAFDFNAAGLTAASFGAVGNESYTGTLTPSGTTYRLGGGGGTLTIDTSTFDSAKNLVLFPNGNTGTVDLAGVSKSFGAITISGGNTQNGTLTGTSFEVQSGTVSAGLAGAGAGLTKTTTGTLTLNGAAANTYTGATTVNRGTLIADFINMTTPTNLIDSGSALVMGGGTLQVKQKSGTITSQTFNGTTINLGASTITATNVSGSAANTLTVALGGITRNAGGLVNVTLPTAGQGVVTTSTDNNGTGFLGRWATTGLTSSLQYAANDGSGNIVAYTGATPATAGTLTNMNSATTNYSFGAAATIPGGYALTGNTLRYTGGAATLEIGATSYSPNTLKLNGLMQAGTGALTIQRSGPNATGGLVIGDTNELVIVTNNQGITINSVIKDGPGGPGSITFASFGGGVLTFGTDNTFSGGLTIAGSVSTATLTSTVLGTGTVTMLPGSNISTGRNTLSNQFVITDAQFTSGNSYTSFLAGPMTINGTLTLNYSGGGNANVSSDISGPGGVFSKGTRLDNSLSKLSGTNTYAGPTTINTGGALEFINRVSLYNGDTAKWTADNFTVNSGGTAMFAVGGAGQFTASDIDTLVSLGTATGGFTDGSKIAFDTEAGDFTYTGLIADTSGGANKLGLTKFGNNTLTLSDNNTYSGPTYIIDGALKVSSLNSVVGGTSSSSLGAPKTVADGTITLGTYVTAQVGEIIYTGTGETTDRVLRLGGNGGGCTLTQSGSGLLKFTSDMTAVANGSQTVTLQGTGDGEFAGAIINAGTGTTSVQKYGTGTWTLSGTNTFTGATGAHEGTLRITGTVVGSATAYLGGTIKLDYGSLDASKLVDASVLTLAGGTLELAGGTHTEIVASTTLASGDSTVKRSSGSATIAMNTITANAGATVSFGASGIATTDNTNTNGILGLWAMVGGTDWAVNSTNGPDGLITAYSGYTDIAARGPASTIADGNSTNVRILSDGTSGNIELGSDTTTVNTVMQRNASYASTINTAGKVLGTSGIVIASGGESVTIGAAANDGTLRAATAGGSLSLINHNPAKAFTVNAVIADNTSASSLGTVGNVTLSGNNTYTGTTGVGGTLTITGVNTGNGNITIGTDSTLAVTGSGRLGSGTFTGTISIGSGSAFTYGSSAAQTISGQITGAGGLTQNGPGTLTISYANNFTGPTTVNGGTLVLTGELYNNINGDSVTVNGGTLAGTGNVGEPLFILGGAKIAPGVNPAVGTLRVDLGVSMAANSIYQWEFDYDHGDKVAINGPLTLDAGWKIALASIGLPSNKPLAGVEYDLFTYTGAFSGSLAAVIDASAVAGWPTATIGQDTTAGAGRIYLTFQYAGDTNSDGIIDAADFITLKRNFGKSTGAGASAGDFNANGTVDWADLNVLTNNIGVTTGAPATTPEPATLGLLALGGLALLRRNRRS